MGPGYTKQQEEDWKTIFYSSMYRASKYPRKLWEIDHKTGKPIHWSPYTGKQEDGVLSSDQVMPELAERLLVPAQRLFVCLLNGCLCLLNG